MSYRFGNGFEFELVLGLILHLLSLVSLEISYHLKKNRFLGISANFD